MTPEFAQGVLERLWTTDTVGAVAMEQLRLQSFQDCQAAEILAKWFGIVVTTEEIGAHDGTTDGEG